jgi:hypothetical protein
VNLRWQTGRRPRHVAAHQPRPTKRPERNRGWPPACHVRPSGDAPSPLGCPTRRRRGAQCRAVKAFLIAWTHSRGDHACSVLRLQRRPRPCATHCRRYPSSVSHLPHDMLDPACPLNQQERCSGSRSLHVIVSRRPPTNVHSGSSCLIDSPYAASTDRQLPDRVVR